MVVARRSVDLFLQASMRVSIIFLALLFHGAAATILVQANGTEYSVSATAFSHWAAGSKIIGSVHIVRMSATNPEGCPSNEIGPYLSETASSLPANTSLVLLLTGGGFLAPCSFEERTIAAQAYGASAVVFEHDEAHRDVMNWRHPYSGELVGVAPESIILTGIVLGEFSKLVPEHPDTLALEQFGLDSAGDNLFKHPLVWIITFMLGICPNAWSLATALMLLYKRTRVRMRGKTKNKGDEVSLRDYVYVSVIFFAFFNITWNWTMLYGGMVESYPTGLPATGDALSIITTTCHFFGRPVSNVTYLLVVIAWVDVLGGMKSRGSKAGQVNMGPFKSRKLQYIFIGFNVAAILFEIFHVVFYVTRSPIDAITGNLSNMSFTLILLVQSVSMLWFGSRVVKALNAVGGGKSSAAKSTAGTGQSRRMQQQVFRMFRLISALAWCYLISFFCATGAVFGGGLNTQGGIVWSILMPETVIRSAATVLFLKIVTPPAKKKKAVSAAGASTAARTAGGDVISREGEGSTVNSAATSSIVGESTAADTSIIGKSTEGASSLKSSGVSSE